MRLLGCLFLFWLVVLADKPLPAHLSVTDGEFIYTHIGLPGQDIALRIRWDLNYIAIFSSIDVVSTSRTYSHTQHSDVFCLGPSCVRMQFSYVSGEPSATYGERSATLQLGGYSGVLGLAPGSPIYGAWPWVRYNQMELELRVTRPNVPKDVMLPLAPGGFFGGRVEGVQYWVGFNLAFDYTLVPWDVSQRKDTWKLEILRSSASTKKSLHLHVAPQNERFQQPDTADVPIVRAGSDVLLDTIVASTHSPVWNASEAIILGRLMVQRMFTLTQSANGTTVWVEPDCTHQPQIDMLDFMPFLIPLMLLLVIWHLGMYEDISDAERTQQIDIPPPPVGDGRTVVLQVGQTARRVPVGELRKPMLPFGVGYQWRAQNLVAFRHHGFTRALFWFTTLVSVSLYLTITMGFGVEFGFRHMDMHVQDLIALYSAGGVMLALCAGAGGVHTQPITGTIYGGCVALVGIWLVSMLRPTGAVMIVMILLSSGALCSTAAFIFVCALMGTLWPGEAYGTTMRSPLEPNPQFRPLLYSFWLVVNALLFAWSAWLFGFYTVPFVINDWRPAHPNAYGIGGLAVIVACVGATGLYTSQRMLMAKLAAIGVARCIEHATWLNEQVLLIEATQQHSS